MPYIYAEAEKLVETENVGTKQCVALIKHYTNAPQTALWKEGDAVRGNASIKKGTAIATFVNGKYPNAGTGNHAAFYISQDAVGVWVVDQWSTSETIRKRPLRFLGKNESGAFIRPSNNGDAFSVIE